MPYIALQLVGMEVVIKTLGLTGELPLAAAFVILALYTYKAGLRAPALIAFVKDLMIYIVVAVVLVSMRLGGYGNMFHQASEAFAAKSADTIRKNAVFLPAYTVLLGYMAYAAKLTLKNNNDVVPALSHRHRGAGAGGLMSIGNCWAACGYSRSFRRWCSACSPAGSARPHCSRAGRSAWRAAAGSRSRTASSRSTPSCWAA